MLNHIKELIKNELYDVKLHTRKRMIERNIKINEVKEAIENGTIIEDYIDDKPLPSCLICGMTSNYRNLHILIAVDEEVAAIITVYEPDPIKWINNTVRRK